MFARLLAARPANPFTRSLPRRATTVHPLGGAVARPSGEAEGVHVDDLAASARAHTLATSLISTNNSGKANPEVPITVLATCGSGRPYASLRTGPVTASAASTSTT